MRRLSMVAGGGDAAKTALQARIAAGNPPAALLMPGQNIIDRANEGLPGNVDALAAAEGGDAALPLAVKDFSRTGGRDVSVPANVHRTDVIRASKAAFDRIGAPDPATWGELNALAPRFLAAGIIPLAHGGQSRQEAYMFEAVAMGIGAADFDRNALVNALSLFAQTDPEAVKAQEVLASAIMDRDAQAVFNLAWGAIPARNDVDMSGLDACAHSTAADKRVADSAGTAVPTFAGTQAAHAAVVGAATDAITGFFNSDMTAAGGAASLAGAIMAAK